MMDSCKICGEPAKADGKTGAKLGDKGSNSINNASINRGSDIRTEKGDVVHKKCQQNWINPERVAAAKKKEPVDNANPEQQRLRSATPTFNFKEYCFYCANIVVTSSKRRSLDVVYSVRTKEYYETLIATCDKRNDKWGEEVKQRVIATTDLIAAEAVYHNCCATNFRNLKPIPQRHQEQPQKRIKLVTGRPVDDARNESFARVLEYFHESDDEQISISDLVKKMDEYLKELDPAAEPYCNKWMRDKLLKHFGNRILICTVNGKPDVVTFSAKAQTILHDFYEDKKKDDPEAEKIRIIEAAAKMIKSDIKQGEPDQSCYPLAEDLSNIDDAVSVLPESLRIFLRTVMSGQNKELKMASIGQALMQAARPRLQVSPLQFGTGVLLHHHFGSRFLIDFLHRLGLCSSYPEVQQFGRSSAAAQGVDLPILAPGTFVQYSADNADHDLCTLDGNNTFHGMGIIASCTPAQISVRNPVPRKLVTSKEIINASKIDIKYYTKQITGLAKMNFEKLKDLHSIPDPSSSFNTLWKASLILKSPRPGWNGFMQMLQKGNHPGAASIYFLPFIDLNPSDLSCIYSTLHFISQQAQNHGFHPIVTFDQPLWWKALQIVKSEEDGGQLASIVLRLGGLHTEMSFLGSMGATMQGSGLEEVLEAIYAKNSIPHMMTGKAISRAIRGHLIVDYALNTMLIAKAYDIPLASLLERNQEGQHVLPDELEPGKDLLCKLINGETCDMDDNLLNQIATKLQKEKDKLKDNRTGQLWLQYMDQADILKLFIASERTGNWKLHLRAGYEMRDYLAATGHNHYAKSLTVYLHLMENLPQTHPEVYQAFINGLHVVRRSDRYWGGLSTDLVIEQVLMRSLKTSGGLTRRRGMSEVQRSIWIGSMPASAEISSAMQELSGLSYQTSEQHKESTKSRLVRDVNDTLEVLRILSIRDPLSPGTELRNIMNGVEADKKVNAHQAKEIGAKIIEDMIGKCIDTYSFKRKAQIVPMNSRASMDIEGEAVQVDPELLFQRLLATVPSSQDLTDLFTFEICSYPPALFDNNALPREATKSVLADQLWLMTKDVNTSNPPQLASTVLDGGALLHKVVWARGKTYEELCSAYVDHIENKYGQSPMTVVFDGYETPSTKDIAHMRRNKIPGPTVQLEQDMICNMKKEDFLSNETNKEQFLKLLGQKLQLAGHSVRYSSGDADCLIVMTALESAEVGPTVVVGSDADLIVMLIHHAEGNGHDLYFKPEPKAQSKKEARTWDVRKTRQALDAKDNSISKHLLFIHALLGCDTTSRVFGVGKGNILNKAINPSFYDAGDTFLNPRASKEDVIDQGEKAMIWIYGESDTDLTLDELRYKKFQAKTSTAVAAVQLKSLPPTSAATEYHSLRVYYQVQEWEGLSSSLEPTQWGWTLSNNKLVPITTHKLPAPSALLKSVRCGCTGDCDTKRCTCRKHGLDCTSICGGCKGTSCTNSPRINELESNEEDGNQ